MRILYISGAFPPMKCGVGDYTAILIEKISLLANVEVGLITNIIDQPLNKNYNFEIFPIVKNWNILDIFNIQKTINLWKPDLVHIQYPTKGYGRKIAVHFLPMILQLKKIPVIETWHEPLSWKGCFRYLPNIFSNGELIVVEPNYIDLIPFWFQWAINFKHPQFIPVASNIPLTIIGNISELSMLRSKFDGLKHNIIAYFGFASPAKGIEYIFQIANPDIDRIVLICEIDSSNSYHKYILNIINQEPWTGKVFVTGFLNDKEVGSILSSADAVVIPFIKGLSLRNASFLAAKTQGSFILTTSNSQHGYNAKENVYYSYPRDIVDMKESLRLYSGKHIPPQTDPLHNWDYIIDKHLSIYYKVSCFR
jgi:glycosyltransferase involved in cell wall biosynthesis